MTVIDRLRLRRQAASATLPAYTGFSLVQQWSTESFVDPKRTVRRLRKCTSTLLQTQEYCNAVGISVNLCDPETINTLTRIIEIISDENAPWNTQGAKMRPAHLIDLFGDFYSSLNDMQHAVKALENKSQQATKMMQTKVVFCSRRVMSALREVAKVVFTLPSARRDSADISDDDEEFEETRLSCTEQMEDIPSLASHSEEDFELATVHSAESRRLPQMLKQTSTSSLRSDASREYHHIDASQELKKVSQAVSVDALDTLDDDWALAYVDGQNRELRTLRSESLATISDACSSMSGSSVSFDDEQPSSSNQSESDHEDLVASLAYLTSVSHLSRARTVSITRSFSKPRIVTCRSQSCVSPRFAGQARNRSLREDSETSVPSSPERATYDYAPYDETDDLRKSPFDTVWGNDDAYDLMHIPRSLCSAKRAEHERNFGTTRMPLFNEQLTS